MPKKIHTVRVGDRVRWTDKIREYECIYRVAAVGKPPKKQGEHTIIHLICDETGIEMRVYLDEIQNRIVPREQN